MRRHASRAVATDKDSRLTFSATIFTGKTALVTGGTKASAVP